MRYRLILLSAYALCLTGAFDAWMLTVSYLLQRQLPCGPSDGCLTVALSSAARFLGVPVPLLGLAFYVLLAGAIAACLLSPNTRAKPVLYPLAAFGAGVSTVYTAYSAFRIHAVCPWCIASSVIACILAILFSFNRADSDRLKVRWVVLPAILTLAAMVFGTNSIVRTAERFPYDPATLARTTPFELLPDDAILVRGKNSAYTAVIFLDVACPACQASFQDVVQAVRERNAGLAVRFLPEAVHPGAFRLDVLSEESAQQGKGLEFLLGAMRQGIVAPTGALELLRSLGGHESDAMLQIARDRVRRDLSLAKRLRLQVTPSIFVVRYDGAVEAATPTTLRGKLGPATID